MDMKINIKHVFTFKNIDLSQAVVAHAFNASTWDQRHAQLPVKLINFFLKDSPHVERVK